jgi:hypothetical protein
LRAGDGGHGMPRPYKDARIRVWKSGASRLLRAFILCFVGVLCVGTEFLDNGVGDNSGG